MLVDGKIFIGMGKDPQYLDLALANRHGLITGATGTGKTVTLQVLAEGFSAAGVPVFTADIKGDLSGISVEGQEKDWVATRNAKIGFDDWAPARFPVIFWDVFGEAGHPVRATISEMGPLMLSRLMSLNEVQEGVLNIAFKVADEQGLLLLDLKDLRALLAYVAEHADELTKDYGNVAQATIGTIQRQLLVMEQQGAEHFFGEPALSIADLGRLDDQGRGTVSVLAADKLMTSPRLYATFLLWLLSELFEQLPEVGDLAKPKLVFFFDEAHLLFDEAPDALIAKIEQVVRLIRSKGVGVYFVTQSPLDVPDRVSAQLGNRIQHALRAFTPREQKAVRAAAETFRQNPDFDTAAVISELAVGEALVSTLDSKGVPSMVQRTLVRPPSGQVGPIDAITRATLINTSAVAGIYDEAVDRESAYEVLRGKAERQPSASQPAADQPKADQPPVDQPPADEPPVRQTHTIAPPTAPTPPDAPTAPASPGVFGTILGGITGMFTQPAARRTDSLATAMVKSAARAAVSSASRQITQAIIRGVMGSMKR